VAAEGAHPLWNAAEQGHEAVARFLAIEADSNIDQTSHDGCTPLRIAAQKSHTAVVRFLVIEAGEHRSDQPSRL